MQSKLLVLWVVILLPGFSFSQSDEPTPVPESPPEIVTPPPEEIPKPEALPTPQDHESSGSEATKIEEEPKEAPQPAPNDLAPSPHKTPSLKEFDELSLSLRPGFQKVSKNPGGWDDPGFTIGLHLSYFFHPRIALDLPYVFTRYDSNVTTHTAGGGPLFRYIDFSYFRGEVDAHFNYFRARSGNHVGWSAGGDFMVGFRNAALRPFLGPFFRFEQGYLPGKDLRAYSIGIGLTLTELADLD